MTSYSCYPCKYLIYSLSCISGLQWLLHFHSPLVRSRGEKSHLQIFLLAFHFLWKSLMKQCVTFYGILRFFATYCFHGRSQLFHLTLLFLVQRHNFDLWPFFASFLDKLCQKLLEIKCSHFLPYTFAQNYYFFLFWFNLTMYFTDLVMILVFISAPMCLSWSVLIDLLPTGDAPHTCSLSYIISYYQCWLALFFLTTGQGKVAWEMRPKCSEGNPKPE